MKKICLVVMLFLGNMSVFAQEHLSYENIVVDGSKKEMIQKLEQEGMKLMSDPDDVSCLLMGEKESLNYYYLLVENDARLSIVQITRSLMNNEFSKYSIDERRKIAFELFEKYNSKIKKDYNILSMNDEGSEKYKKITYTLKEGVICIESNGSSVMVKL